MSSSHRLYRLGVYLEGVLQRGDGVDAGEGRVRGGGRGEGQHGQGAALGRRLEQRGLLVLGHEPGPEAGGGELLQGGQHGHCWGGGLTWLGWV